MQLVQFYYHPKKTGRCNTLETCPRKKGLNASSRYTALSKASQNWASIKSIDWSFYHAEKSTNSKNLKVSTQVSLRGLRRLTWIDTFVTDTFSPFSQNMGHLFLTSTTYRCDLQLGFYLLNGV